jgi:hypothetical protein
VILFWLEEIHTQNPVIVARFDVGNDDLVASNEDVEVLGQRGG